MQPPFLIEDNGRVALVEWKETTLLGPGKLNGFYLDDPGKDAQWNSGEVTPLIRPTEGNNGQILRFVLANRWLDFEGTSRMSIALKACVDFSSFQLRPLVKFFGEANRRLLIADETGLGKTIEAGMILAEVLAAKPNSCIVILTPASVKWKWKKELRDKFGINASYGNFKKFRELSVPKGVHIITHSASKEETEIKIPMESIELLIIDEIHNFIGRSSNQKRRMRAMDLSRASKGMIGLSATPIQLEANDLRRILDLISPGEFTESSWEKFCKIQIAVNNVLSSMKDSNSALKEDVEILRDYWDNTIPIRANDLLDGMEKEAWHEVELRVKAIGPIGRKMTRARARDSDVIGPDGKSLLRKRIVCNHTVEMGEYEKLISDLDSFISEHMSFVHRRQFASCPAAVFNLFNAIQDKSIDPTPLLIKTQQQMANHGPKQNQLLKILSEMQGRKDVPRVVIFTHWHPTFFYLEPILRNRFNLFSVNPNMEDKSIPAMVNKFRECDTFAVLLVTDKMSEGVDLEMANVMINMDLPYNPARLQQRIGRLDRYIQESDFIEIHNLVLERSLEERQIDILEKRLQVFKTMIGGFEAIISNDWDEGEPEGIESGISRTRDLIRLSEENTVLRVIDSGFDGIISQAQNELNPITSNQYRIIEGLMKIFQSDVEYLDGKNLMKVRIPETLRLRILKPNSIFIPSGQGIVRAIFERVDEEGYITFRFKGKDATFGPFDPFLAACQNILIAHEGFTKSLSVEYPHLSQSKSSETGWEIQSSDEIKQSVRLTDIVEDLKANTLKITHWCYGDAHIRGKID